MSLPKQYRHGDLFIVQVANFPELVAKKKGNTLAEGEATGHHHKVETLKLSSKYMVVERRAEGPVQILVTGDQLLKRQGIDFQGGRKAPTLYERDGQIYFQCHGTSVLTHQEHGAIVLPPGHYLNRIQIEYVPAAAPRRVID